MKPIMYKKLCKANNLITTSKWIFAKTMPQNPHWYTLRKHWNNDAAFNHLVEFIREHGYPGRYGRTTYKYLNINGMKYWTMGAPVADTILINRAEINQSAQYDNLASTYDSMFSDNEFIQENKELIQLIPEVGQRVLDIGCGTGLLLDYISIDDYCGIDPSSGMLAELTKKHQDVHVIQTPFEEYCNGRFDTIVSLFASASYIDPEYLHRIPMMLKPGGHYFIMFFKPGYEPEAHKQSSNEFKYYHNSHEILDGDKTEFRNYIIVQGTA